MPRPSHSWRDGVLELEAQPHPAAQDQQIELGAGVRGPPTGALGGGVCEIVDICT
jgi:hypothetical protein